MWLFMVIIMHLEVTVKNGAVFGVVKQKIAVVAEKARAFGGQLISKRNLGSRVDTADSALSVS